MKKYLLTGLIILLPAALTMIILVWMLNILTDPFSGMVERFILAYEGMRGINLHNHELFVALLSRSIVLLALFLVILTLGFIGHRFFFHQLTSLSHKLFHRIPIVKTIYRLASDVTGAFLQQKDKTFKQTVLIPFPSEGTHALGLVTGNVPISLQKKVRELELSVFVPTAPHPTSGYILLSAKKETIPIDMSTEDVFRFLLSCGVVIPKEESTEQSE